MFPPTINEGGPPLVPLRTPALLSSITKNLTLDSHCNTTYVIIFQIFVNGSRHIYGTCQTFTFLLLSDLECQHIGILWAKVDLDNYMENNIVKTYKKVQNTRIEQQGHH